MVESVEIDDANASRNTPTTCRLCGHGLSDAFVALPLVGEHEFRYRRCRSCGLAQLAETPSIGALRTRYATHYQPVCGEFVTGRRSLLSRLRKVNFDLMARRIEARVPKGRLLEVGCGSGVFLVAMRRRGWVVAGLEPHQTSAQDLRTHHGLDVRAGMLEDAPIQWGPFDAVALLDVIEHLVDPAAALAKVRALLRPGGVLILATPNVASLEHRLFGRQWFALQPPDHLWLFSPDSLRRTVAMAGFDQVSLAASPVAYAWPSLCRCLGIQAPSGAFDAAMKVVTAGPMALLGMLRGAPANLELYARRAP